MPTEGCFSESALQIQRGFASKSFTLPPLRGTFPQGKAYFPALQTEIILHILLCLCKEKISISSSPALNFRLFQRLRNSDPANIKEAQKKGGQAT